MGSDEGISFEKSYKGAKAVVIPFGMESTVSYGGGTKKGPRAIIEASHQVETTDEQTLGSPYKSGIATLREPKIPKNPKVAIALLEKIVSRVLKDNKFPIILGGEHSLTLGLNKAICKKYGRISLLQFDAHADMRDSYHGSSFSHAAVVNQIMKKLPVDNVVQVGIRNISFSNNEMAFREKNKLRIKTFWAWQKFGPTEIVRALKNKNILITFDVDAFDPSIMPSTGTPEPGGLFWWPTLQILAAVFKSKNVVGCDVVELAPIRGLHAPDFLAAKLVYKMIGYKFNN